MCPANGKRAACWLLTPYQSFTKLLLATAVRAVLIRDMSVSLLLKARTVRHNFYSEATKKKMFNCIATTVGHSSYHKQHQPAMQF